MGNFLCTQPSSAYFFVGGKSAARWSVHAFRNCVPFAGTVVESVAGVCLECEFVVDGYLCSCFCWCGMILVSKPASA